jgi:hypothetical protein
MGVKRPGREADQSLSSAEVKSDVSIPPLPHTWATLPFYLTVLYSIIIELKSESEELKLEVESLKPHLGRILKFAVL